MKIAAQFRLVALALPMNATDYSLEEKTVSDKRFYVNRPNPETRNPDEELQACEEFKIKIGDPACIQSIRYESIESLNTSTRI